MNLPKHIVKSIFLLPFLCTAVSLFLSFSAQASHIIGAEISYQRLPNGRYKVVLDVYRDCYYGQAPFDTPARISIYTGNGVFYNNLNTGILFSDTIPNNIAGDPCLFIPGDVCVEHARYENTVLLPPSPTGYYFVYQRCCRNETIANIFNPDHTGSTYYVYLSKQAMDLQNSSPKFGFYPPVFVCVNKWINHPHAAIDQDAVSDSLVYKFYTPFTGATFDQPQPQKATPPPYDNDTVVWKPPYSLSNILPANPLLQIDPHTGLITGFPKGQGQFVVGVAVEEYRNGSLLSVVRRDFQYNVGVCDSIIPKIIAPLAQCDDLTVTFKNQTTVAKNFVWYFNYPETTPTSTLKEPTFTFPDTGTYTIAMIAEPGSVCVDTGYHQIFLQYNSLAADFSFQTYDCDDQSVLSLVDLSVDNVSPPSQWFWEVTFNGQVLTSVLQNPAFVVPNPSSGTISLTVRSANGCEQVRVKNFTTGNNNPVAMLPTNINICIGESAQLNPNGISTGFTYQWGPPVPPALQNAVNPTVTPLQTTNYHVTITGFGGLCTASATVKVTVFPLVELDFEPDTDCDARVVHFDNLSQNAPFGYVWIFGDPTNPAASSTQAEPTYTYPDFGTYTVTLMTAPNAVCKDTISKTITLSEKILKADFGYQYTDCDETAIQVQFFDVSVNNQFNTTGWLWEFSGAFNGTSTQPSPTIVLTQEGTLTVQLTITTAEGCESTSAQKSLTIDLTELDSLSEEVLGCLSAGVDLNPGGNPNYIYQWSPPDGLSCNGCPDPSTYFNPHANPSQTTVYTVSVQNISADTCEIVKQVKVVVPPDVQLIAGPDITTCEAQITLTASSSLPANLLWFQGGTLVGMGNSLTVNVSGVVTYTVVATDDLNCKYAKQVTVAGGPVDMATSGNDTLCSNEPLHVFATNLDSNDVLVYTWSPAGAFIGPPIGSNPSVNVVPGQQTLYVEAVNQFGCKKNDSLQLSVVDENLHLDFDYLVDCSGNQVKFTNLSTNAYNFVWDFGDPTTSSDISNAINPSYSYPDTGTYLVKLTIGFDVSCTDTIEKEVKIAETQFLVNFDYEYLDCSEDSIVIQFYDATAIFLPSIDIIGWLWETSTGNTSTLQNPVFTAYAGEVFDITLTIFTSNDCSGTKARSLKFDFIKVNLADTINLCQGDTTQLNPASNGGYVYQWSPNLYLSDPNSHNPLAFPPATTTYTVSITNFVPDTCTLVKTVTVFVPEKISVSADDDTLTCGGPVVLHAGANVPAGFTWSVGNNVIWQGASLTVQPPTDTEYKVTGTDQYGCKDSTTVFVANESVKINLSNPGKECPGVEIHLTVSNDVGDHTLGYEWSATPPGQILPPDNTATVAALTAPAGQTATYTVVATNQFGCKDTLSRAVSTYDFVPTVVQPGIQACAGVSQALNPGADPNLTYLWSPPAGLSCTNCPNPTVTVSQTTLYSVMVSDNFTGKICQEVLDVQVFVPPVIDIAETVDTFTCGSSIVIGATAAPPAALQWFDAAGNLLGSGNTLTVNPAVVEKYFVVATDTFGCKAADTVVVANNQLDLFVAGNGVIDTCPQPSYNICITNLDPNDVLTFSWTTGNGGQIQSGADTDCPTVSTPTGQTTLFIADVANQWGCKTTKTLSVLTHDFNPATEDLKQICPGLPTELNPTGNPQLNYQWSPPTGLSCVNCPNPVATLFASQTYTVSIAGNFGTDVCSALKSVQVDVSPPIDLTAQASDTLLCELKNVLLTAQNNAGGTITYLWSESLGFNNPIGTASQLTVAPVGAKTYYVQATDVYGCKDTAMVSVNAFPINVSLADRFNFCVDDLTITIVANNNEPAQQLQFTWQEPQYLVEIGPNGNPAIVSVSDTTTLHVLIRNQFGCTTLDSTTVFYYESIPDVFITSTKDTLIFAKGEFSQLNVPFDSSWIYDWTPPAGLSDPFIHNPTASPDQTTEYTVMVSNEGGCFNGAGMLIVVINPECDEPNIFVPKAFTPNGDGENDILYVRSNVVEQLEFVIYNRWGQKVFETTNQSIGWDGTFKNEVLAPDVYAFYVKAKCYNGGEFFKKGNITLLR